MTQKDNRQAIMEAGDRRDWDECDRLEGVNQSLLPDGEPISPALLGAFGFWAVHENVHWGGRYMMWRKDISSPHNFVIKVTFGCDYCLNSQVDFIVWISIGVFMISEVPLAHIKTAGQLRQLWLALSGEELVEVIR